MEHRTPDQVPAQERLSVGLGDLWRQPVSQRQFDVVIVGSGYGGSVAADALAGGTIVENGQSRSVKVCVLERGREYLPGEFPSRFADVAAHVRMAHQSTGKVRGFHDGLFDLRIGDDVNVLAASGLGGGSLINAGVMLAPSADAFPAGSAMHELVASLHQGGHFQEAKTRLGASLRQGPAMVDNTIADHPAVPPDGLRKTRALGLLAGNGHRTLMPVTVAMTKRSNSAGVELPACALCGDCMTGCNVGAKDSLDANLLESAARHGVSIYTGASVVSLRRGRGGVENAEGMWILRVVHTDPVLQEREPRPLYIRAKQVILAAGTLGSTEILLRSRTDLLAFSPLLGKGFSCNGDNIAAVHRMPGKTRISVPEGHAIEGRMVGPTITAAVTGHVHVPGEATRSFLIQEFAIPAALKQVLDEVVTTAAVINDMPKADWLRHGKERAGKIDPLAVNPLHMGRTLVVGLIGHDDALGTLLLPDPLRPTDRPAQPGTIAIRWPDARHAFLLDASHQVLAERVDAVRARIKPTLVANPMWRLLPDELADLVSQPRGPVLTVHPLGGCRMGTEEEPGVVDRHGRVLDMKPGQDAWQGSLAVLDGAILPGSLGVNPALTIAATAMRAMADLSAAWGITLRGAPTPASGSAVSSRRRLVPSVIPIQPVPDVATEIELTERLSGPVTLLADRAPAKPYVAELTLAYAPVRAQGLLTTLGRRLDLHPDATKSTWRLFRQEDWEKYRLATASDQVRRTHVFLQASLKGHLDFLHREPSCAPVRAWRGGLAWLLNRGLRDTWQALIDQDKHIEPVAHLKSLLRMATRAGEVRRFDYHLRVDQVQINRFQDERGRMLACVHPGDRIHGSKRLTYGRRASPWRQLTELTVDDMPGLVSSMPAMLKLDARFLANQGYPLLRLTQQRDQIKALMDLATVGLQLARVLVNVHLWTFRKPDTPDNGEPQRLPGVIQGLPDPDVTELVVDRIRPDDLIGARDTARYAVGEPVKVRLTRYRPAGAQGNDAARAHRPLVMIHGYSVSGNTFTHPTLTPSAAGYFCQQGREVWVVDLRTSSGMPLAGLPWAMERVALVDIPAALLHIRLATDSKIDVLAHCIGCVMLSMALLSDANEVRNSDLELGVTTWLTSEHFGTLQAFNGVRADGEPHPCIDRVVLSQKGPVLRYTDSNILRAFVLQSVRRWLMQDDYQFRPNAEPKVAEQLMDRLLSSVPYPDEDYDVENPLNPFKTTPWTATRHRMDALYGRDFNAANLHDATLRAIDDLFGPINLDTVAQTIHFARFRCITNQRGRGEFVTRRRLRERWSGIPTMIMHGRENGLIDVSTQDLLARQLKASKVPVVAPCVDQAPYDRLGHQDLLIGRDCTPVFEDLDRFLKMDEDAFTALVDPKQEDPIKTLAVAIPWLGPRMTWPSDTGGVLKLACMSPPQLGRARLYLFPAQCEPAPDGSLTYRLIRNSEGVAGGSEESIGASGNWLLATPDLGRQTQTPTGYICLMCYDLDETTEVEEAWPFIPNNGQNTPAQPPANGGFRGEVPGGEWALPLDVLRVPGLASDFWPSGHDDETMPVTFIDAINAWMATKPSSVMSTAYVSLANLRRAREAMTPRPAPREMFKLALASCQYPGGLLDAQVAGQSLLALAGETDTTVAPLDLVLFLGDQIYADATAGLVDPVRRDELYEQPHEKALRVAGMRRILRSVPVRTLPDDHEIEDNWEPLPDGLLPAESEHRQKQRDFGLQAWRKFQALAPAAQAGATVGKPQPVIEAFHCAGHPFLMCDTRSGRSARGSLVAPADRQILAPHQWAVLSNWLFRRAGQLKFVATSALLLPRRRQTGAESAGGECSDAWDGYAASLHRLLSLLLEHDIKRTVFLSGDEHHSLFAEIKVWRKGQPARCVDLLSVHSSGLYAPFPFANGHPDDLRGVETFELMDLEVQVKTTFAAPGDGYVTLEVLDSAQGVALDFVRPQASGVPQVKRHVVRI